MFVNRYQVNLSTLSSGATATTINIPISMDFQLIDQTELVKRVFVDVETEKAINPIIDYDKARYLPLDLQGVHIDKVIYNVDLLGSTFYDSIGFTNDDIKFQTEAFKQTFLSLNFYDSDNPLSQNLITNVTLYAEIKSDNLLPDIPTQFSQYGYIVGTPGQAQPASMIPLRFVLESPLLNPTQTICLLGDSRHLRAWDAKDPILLSRKEGEDYFSVSLDLSKAKFPIAYKYGIYDVAKKSFVAFENGNNRILHDAPSETKLTIVNDGFTYLPNDTWKGAGVAIPVFSLRSNNGLGVGEFADIKLLVDWAKKVGLKKIQLLPINDTTATHSWKDSYPYAAISAFALHPLYIHLDSITNNTKRFYTIL
jgi:hypothetical protein